MATSSKPRNRSMDEPTPDGFNVFEWRRKAFRWILKTLSSLQLTVVLLSMSILLVIAGTFAQDYIGLWQVVDSFFRAKIAWIKFQYFFPKAFFNGSPPEVPGGFFWPGGWLLGSALGANLVAAHLVRFKIQAHGLRLLAGILVTLFGVGVTWLVIETSSSDVSYAANTVAGVQTGETLQWSSLWLSIKIGLFLIWVGAAATAAVLFATRSQHRRRAETWIAAVAAGGIAPLLIWILLRGDDHVLGDSSMRILWQLIKATFAGAVLLAGCWLVFGRRAGIVLIHGGIALVMANELVVHNLHTEASIDLYEGQAINYLVAQREFELAVVDTSGTDSDDVVSVPLSRLLRGTTSGDDYHSLLNGKTIEDEFLAFDAKLVKYILYSELSNLKPDEKNLANTGQNKRIVARPTESKLPPGKKEELYRPSAYFEFFRKGTSDSLGIFMLSTDPRVEGDVIVLDGKSYQLDFRHRHIYTPYAVKVKEVKANQYVGTGETRDFTTIVQIIGLDKPHEGLNREVRIWMNNPLRFAGATFYQSGQPAGDIMGRKRTILQVVANTGWMIPYVACMIVATGLLAQFIVVLLRFLNGRAAGAVDLPPVIRAASDISPAPGGWQPLVNRWFPTGTVLLAVLLAGYCAIPPKTSEEEMQIHEFGKLPIMYQGRMKPYDSLARNSMRFLSDRQTCIDPEGNRQPAIRWLLEVISGSPRADEYEVFRIASLEVIDALGLERRKGFRYAFDEFKPKLHELHEPSELISKKHRDDVPLSMYERQLEKFLRKIQMYQKLRHSWRLPKRDLDGLKQIEEVEQALRLENDATNSTLPRALPPEATETQWKPFVTESTRNWIKYIAADRGIQTPAELSEAFVDDYKNDLASKEEKTTLTDEQSKILSDKLTGAIQRLLIVENEKGEPSITKLDEPDPAAQAMISMLYAYTDDDTETFNAELKNFRAAISEDEKFKSMLPTSSSGSWFKPVTDFEANFNHAEPFFWFAVLYFLGFLMATFSWLGWSRPLNKAAFSLIAVTLIFHTLALICRIYISGRPPVTNLYSSAVFIGWGAVIFGLVMERKFRIGVGNVIAGVAGCATLIIAHLIALEKDTILVLSAVLDTQFWLATHVVCITLGYTATFVAGILGIIFVIGGVFTTALSKKIDTISVEGIPVKVNGQTLDKVLGRMIYGSLCFAIFFSFVGTVLGGLWADDSWGRFWGWDPKENGALVIVLWNAIILHSRWGGFAKSRGIAVLAMGGNIVTSFSWFGVNQLGIGLHSYGQAENVLMALGVFTLAQLALIGVGCLPKSLWASYAEQQRAKEAEAFRRSKRKST